MIKEHGTKAVVFWRNLLFEDDPREINLMQKSTPTPAKQHEREKSRTINFSVHV